MKRRQQRMITDPAVLERDAEKLSSLARAEQADGYADGSHALVLMAASLRRAATAIREGRIKGVPSR